MYFGNKVNHILVKPAPNKYSRTGLMIPVGFDRRFGLRAAYRGIYWTDLNLRLCVYLRTSLKHYY